MDVIHDRDILEPVLHPASSVVAKKYKFQGTNHFNNLLRPQTNDVFLIGVG